MLDLLRYHLFSGAYLWKDELGSAEVPEEREYLEKLSPLVAAQRERAYPATLVTTRKLDTRVAPMNAYKFAAALSDHQKGTKPVLLRVDENRRALHLEPSSSTCVSTTSQTFTRFAWDMASSAD